MTGIYKITNQINGKSYIGQSVDIEKRWKRHRNYSREGNKDKYDNHLYRAIRKYGIENFSFEVLELCDKDKLNVLERHYISEFQSNNPDYGYNMTIGGEGGCRHDRKYVCDLWEQGLSISAIAKIISGSRNTVKDILRECNVDYQEEARRRWIKAKSRPVEQYDMDKNLVRIWPSAREASRVLGADHSRIGDCCNYMVKRASGYIWRYANRSETAAMADLLD